MRELHRTAHFLLVEDPIARIVTRTRTAERFASLDQVTSEYDALVHAFERVDRSVFAQLVDLRQAPARNDDAFEAIVTGYQPALYDRFRRVAVVVATAAGRLQLRRFLTESRPDAGLYTDLDEATAYLRA
ncbi:MAG TPA: hypothetical protein VGL81_26320 [Polyangiaceae bacterium]